MPGQIMPIPEEGTPKAVEVISPMAEVGPCLLKTGISAAPVSKQNAKM